MYIIFRKFAPVIFCSFEILCGRKFNFQLLSEENSLMLKHKILLLLPSIQTRLIYESNSKGIIWNELRREITQGIYRVYHNSPLPPLHRSRSFDWFVFIIKYLCYTPSASTCDVLLFMGVRELHYQRENNKAKL